MKIEVRNSKIHGRGVFATKKIRKGELIEVCPVLVVPKEQVPLMNKTVVKDYHFIWDGRKTAIALGYGSIYNHSYDPNARYCDYGDTHFKFRAWRTIHPGEEITVNYNGDPTCRRKVWFDR